MSHYSCRRRVVAHLHHSLSRSSAESSTYLLDFIIRFASIRPNHLPSTPPPPQCFLLPPTPPMSLELQVICLSLTIWKAKSSTYLKAYSYLQISQTFLLEVKLPYDTVCSSVIIFFTFMLLSEHLLDSDSPPYYSPSYSSLSPPLLIRA